jgi:hypothetical protein
MEKKEPLMGIETDVEALQKDAANPNNLRGRQAIGAIRRTFLVKMVEAFISIHPFGEDTESRHLWAWDEAEKLYAEGKKRGYLP